MYTITRFYIPTAVFPKCFREHLPLVRESLNPGASEEELCSLEMELGCALPSGFKALWRVHDGQTLNFDQVVDTGVRTSSLRDLTPKRPKP